MSENAQEKLPPMVAMSEAIRETMLRRSGVAKITDLPDADLQAYAEIVLAYGIDLRGEVRRRKPLSWTQPLCWDCWDARNPERPVDRQDTPQHGDVEVCCDCGYQTVSGIYLRIDPDTVTYPARKE